jgi:hypothetical protein
VARPLCNGPVATRLRSPNGSAGVIASELAASVALDRSTPPPSVIRGHTGWETRASIARSSVMAKKKKAKKKSKGY